MDDFLTKPIALDALRQALTRWLKAASPPQPSGTHTPLRATRAQHPSLSALLAETRALLAQHKFDAIDRFEMLQTAAAQTRLAAGLTDIEPLIKSLRFAEALTLLQQLSEAP